LLLPSNFKKALRTSHRWQSTTAKTDGDDSVAGPLIRKQISMAKRKFQESLRTRNSTIPTSLRDSIVNDLELGYVPPVFHALVRGKPEVDKNALLRSTNAVSGNRPHETDKQSMFMGVGGKDLNSLVSDGESRELCCHDGMRIWHYVEIHADVAAHLVNEKAQMLGHGVEATKVTGLMGLDDFDRDATGGPFFLLTRPESRGVVASCFAFGATTAIIGSPGIGKSWNLLYALQQALLYDNATVLLHTDDSCELFLRRNEKI
jgi:hypothetical protein